MRIAGVNVPDLKRIDIALTYIYGVGRSNVREVLVEAKIDSSKQTKDLTEEEIGRIQKVLDSFRIEGELKAETISEHVVVSKGPFQKSWILAPMTVIEEHSDRLERISLRMLGYLQSSSLAIAKRLPKNVGTRKNSS